MRHLNATHNRLQRLPAGLTAASQLTALHLTDNSHLSLTLAEVDSLLARLPHLVQLSLLGTGMPEDVAAHAYSIVDLRRD